MRSSSLVLILLAVVGFAPACFNAECWDPDPDCKRWGGHFDESCHCVGMNYSYPTAYPTSTAPPTAMPDAHAPDVHVSDAGIDEDASSSSDASYDASGE